MTVEVILGLPYLSAGPMTQTARRLGATVLLSASTFCRYTDVGPMPARWLAEGHSGNRGKRAREWSGWNLQQLVHAQGLTLDLDSAGFVSLMVHRGYDWTPASYVNGLCAAYPWRRVSSLDMCVEPEIARDRATEGSARQPHARSQTRTRRGGAQGRGARSQAGRGCRQAGRGCRRQTGRNQEKEVQYLPGLQVAPASTGLAG